MHPDDPSTRLRLPMPRCGWGTTKRRSATMAGFEGNPDDGLRAGMVGR